MSDMQLKMFRLRQRIDKTSIDDPYAETRREMLRLHFPFEPEQTIAITAGSRGIDNILPILRAVVDHFREIGLRPFVVPAMGSHGGGTAEGQLNLLAEFDLTPESLGCPIHSGMATVVLGELDIEGTNLRCPIHFDRFAFGADFVFPVNRIKSHTRFSGPIESGLLKMLMIGLGNAEGASSYHRAVSDNRFPVVIRQAAEFLLEKVFVPGGLGIVENGEGKTAVLRAIPAPELSHEEEKLLCLSKRLMPRLPFDEIDLLFIERFGKNISGTGFDSNVVGRKFDDHKAVADERPVVRCIALGELTSASEGNANGIGMAEFCRSSLLRRIDWKKTRFNAMTANHVSAAMVPLDYETDEEILEAARLTLGHPDPSGFRVIRIRDTLHLEEMIASEALRPEAERNGLEILDDLVSFTSIP